MTDEDQPKAKAKPSYGDEMRKKLKDERKKDKENPTRKKAKKAKKMRR